LRERLQRPADKAESRSEWVISGGVAASSEAIEPVCFRPAPGWTFLLLNSFAVSVEQDPSLPGYQQAMAALEQHNPQVAREIAAGRKPGNFFAGITEETDMRYVPFNGGFGATQLTWLRAEVRAASQRGDRVVVLTHVPIYVGAASSRTLVYDAEEALAVLHEEGNGQVVACIAGHLHRGGYGIDDAGVHHVTLPSPLNFARCYGHIDVYDDRLELAGGTGIATHPQLPRVMPFPVAVAGAGGAQVYKCVLEALP